MSGQLSIYENAKHYVALYESVDEVKDYIDKAAAITEYARRANDVELEHKAAKARLWAERRAGELLRDMDKAKGARGQLIVRDGSGGTTVVPPEDTAPKLSDIGVSKNQSSNWQQLATVPEEDFTQELSTLDGKNKVAISARTILKKAKKKKQREEHQAAVDSVSESARESLVSICDIRHCSMRELLTSGINPDCIITDPPYPKEYLPLYGDLAELAKDVPLVAVMCGQSYLPEIMEMMCRHLQYRWTLAYLTPGAAMRQWQRNIDCTWKPVLLFGDCSDYVFDVFKSQAGDKRYHEWGQSESGTSNLVDRLSKPGQLVCDPFLGAGTTAVVSINSGRRFVGCDVDADAVSAAIGRCELAHATA